VRLPTPTPTIPSATLPALRAQSGTRSNTLGGSLIPKPVCCLTGHATLIRARDDFSAKIRSGTQGGVNFYAYTRNNPVVRIDPFGYDGTCNNPAYCVPGSATWGTMYLGPDGVWYNDGPPPDPAPPVPDDGPTPPPNPPSPNKCDKGDQPPVPPVPPDEPPPPQDPIPTILLPPIFSERTCAIWGALTPGCSDLRGDQPSSVWKRSPDHHSPSKLPRLLSIG